MSFCVLEMRLGPGIVFREREHAAGANRASHIVAAKRLNSRCNSNCLPLTSNFDFEFEEHSGNKASRRLEVKATFLVSSGRAN
jgi:hypothetical protein